MSKPVTDRGFKIDALLAVLYFFAALMSLDSFPASEVYRPIDAWLVLLIAAETLTLAWRRRFPVAVLAIVGFAFAIERGLNYPQSWAVFGTAFALYTVGAEVPTKMSRRVAAISVVLAAGWTATGSIVYDFPLIAVLGVLFYLGFPWLIGTESRRKEQRVLEAEARAIRSELAKDQATADAVRDERERIARELHDVVAHEITVMTVQAAAAGRVVGTEPERAREAMGNVEEAGHRGLAEMRRMLGVLRDSEDRSLEPQPGLGGLGELVAAVSDAGLTTTLSIHGDRRDLPVGVDLSAYRIVQESLTNSVRHGGPGVAAEVRVLYGESELEIEISDDGRGAAALDATAGSGHGIIGMRQRVALLDGSLSTGPRTGGGYRVHASIPIPS